MGMLFVNETSTDTAFLDVVQELPPASVLAEDFPNDVIVVEELDHL